jgi:uncharacterized membrane protein
MYPESKCILNLNDTWVNQEVKPNQLNEIDLTGYARKGVNLLFASFPFVEGRSNLLHVSLWNTIIMTGLNLVPTLLG